MYTPTEEAIRKVMSETGMDYMQAVYHLRGRHMLQQNAQVARRMMGMPTKADAWAVVK